MTADERPEETDIPAAELGEDEENAGPKKERSPALAESEEEESPLDAEIEALTSELEELRDRHLRLAAEFDNFRKRTVRERAQDSERAQAEIVKELLESLDDLERFTELGTGKWDTEALLEGIQLVERKLRRVLEGRGLREIPAEGETFDPELHEALSAVPVEDPDEDGLVAQQLAKGYLFKDTLLRPALVEVKKYRGEAEDRDSQEAGEREEKS